jgi:pyruvate,orthophosphate dikinase
MGVSFTIDNGQLQVGDAVDMECSALAAVRCAVALHDDPEVALSPAEAVRMVAPEKLDALLHHHHAGSRHRLLGSGTGVAPGVGVGRLCCSVAAAIGLANDGEAVVLAVNMTSAADEPAMRLAAGVITAHGGPASHAAVLARAWGIPAVCAVGVEGQPVTVTAAGLVDPSGQIVVPDGTEVSVDGTSGEVFAGEVPVVDVVAPPELDRLLEWADRVCAGQITVLANADTPAEVCAATDFGAVGIGMCRTEHQMIGDRVDLLRDVLGANDGHERSVAIDALAVSQRSEFVALLTAAGNRPVTVRLLDPPLHEFLPSVEELLVAQADTLTAEEALEGLVVARRHRESNPMLGTRGVRMAVMLPGLYEAQCRALASAVMERRSAGWAPQVRLLLPMVATASEFATVAASLRAVWADVTGGDPVEVGAMVETPRAALVADELARSADFLSFGTNDLTQLVFGFSRDDVASVIDRYLADGLMTHDPFVSLDEAGVGVVVADAVQRARSHKPSLEIGVCGEHAGDPRSIAALVAMGVDTLSCVPLRVPVARLAAAHAALDGAVPRPL